MTRLLYTALDVVPAPKGASTHILQFVRALVNAGFEVDLLTPGDGILPPRGEIEGASIIRVPAEPGGTYLDRALGFRAAVEARLRDGPGYAAVHYRSIWGGLVAGQLRREVGFQTIYEVNGLPSIELKYHYPGLRDTDVLMKMREQELATLALSDAVICVSRVTREFLISLGTPAEKITVIPNGVATEEFLPPRRAPFAREDPASDAGSTRRPPTFLYLGTLAEWQGLELLLDAWRIVLDRAESPVHLRIVGRGRSRQRKVLAKRLRKLGMDSVVTVEPPVPHHEVPALFDAVDACVAPLLANDRNVTQGCCPIKVLEYMAVGRPIVASNLPVVRELVREDEEAILFAPGDAEDLARKVLRLAAAPELARELSERALERVRKDFPWKRARRDLVKLYEEELGVRPAAAGASAS